MGLKIAAAMVIFSFGMLAGSLITIAEYDIGSRQDLERRVDAYRMCMQSAGTTRCRMTPEDFVDYYDLQHRLLQLEE